MKLKHLTCVLLLIASFVFMTAGCQQPPEISGHTEVSPPEPVKNAAAPLQARAEEAKAIIRAMEEVTDVTAVSFEKELYIAPQVKHSARLRLKEIREAGHRKLTKRWPGMTIYLSTDQKAYMELEKLEREVHQRQLNKSDINKRLGKVQEYMKG
ncbi:hypothetical protein ACFPU1_15440 [Thalassorhabdus alkalitolerans]|uniref:Sporulation lipoprotein YhcN/YlaJ (Spore_YhcN_YlaJ) n=1 Tax=Thalassorhabdus alkalitolerans TaxID=2282697 RepID=A0ABW0YSJ7_9BACI